VRTDLFPPVADKFSIQTEGDNARLSMVGFGETARGKTDSPHPEIKTAARQFGALGVRTLTGQRPT
jgi:hypothetical protein